LVELTPQLEDDLGPILVVDDPGDLLEP